AMTMPFGMTLGRPELLWLAGALPALVLVALLLYARRRRKVVTALGDPALVRRLGAGELSRFPWARLVLLLPAAAALGAAAADPRWGAESVETHGSAFNVALALDVSKSMWAKDVAPDRLERERLLAKLLMQQMPGDRFGIVVFAGRAYVLTPLTSDHAALELYVDALDPEMVSQGGTSLASAIRQGTGLVMADPQIKGDRALVLETDGEALEEEADVLAAARTAAAAGVTIFAAGLGTTQGAPIPELDPGSGRELGWKRDEDGTVVVSHLNEPLLRQVAEITHGQYFRMADPGAAGALASAVRALRRAPGAEGRRVEQKEQYAWFAGLALLLLALDTIVSRRALLRAEEATEAQPVAAGLPRPEAAGARPSARRSQPPAGTPEEAA
ncbi:MAG TPA: VWA domain-containing protein, partial [Longimicrobiales bacterium]